MKDKILLVFMTLVAVFFFYRMQEEHELNKMLQEHRQVTDSLIVVRNNMIAQLGEVNHKLKIQNAELKGVSDHLQLKIKSYVNILQKIKATGKTNLKPDTVVIYRSGDSTSYSVKRFSLLSDDSCVYADGYITQDSIYADSMGARVNLYGYYGIDPTGKPWFLIRSNSPSVSIFTDFQYTPQKRKTEISILGGLFLDDHPGVLGAVKYNAWQVGVGVKTDGTKVVTFMKEVKF